MAGEIGVNTSTLRNWRTLPDIMAAVRELTQAMFADYVPDVIMAMKNEALAGNVHAARLFLEFVDDIHRDDPALNRPNWNKKEVNIIINNLEQKFYGDHRPNEDRPIEGTAEPIV